MRMAESPHVLLEAAWYSTLQNHVSFESDLSSTKRQPERSAWFPYAGDLCQSTQELLCFYRLAVACAIAFDRA